MFCLYTVARLIKDQLPFHLHSFSHQKCHLGRKWWKQWLYMQRVEIHFFAVTASGQMLCLLFIRPEETVKTVTNFILGGSKITANGDWSHEIKRCLLLGEKIMTNLDSILKSRDITLPTKVYLVKAMVFPVVMYGCERWTIKKAQH